MIPALGAGGPGFKPRNGPFLDVLLSALAVGYVAAPHASPPPKNVGRQTHWYNDRENSFTRLT